MDLPTLARNARTGVAMMERFYSSSLIAEMNIDLLQGKRTCWLEDCRFWLQKRQLN